MSDSEQTLFQQIRQRAHVATVSIGVGSLTLGFHHNGEAPDQHTLTIRLPDGEIQSNIPGNREVKGQMHSNSDVLVHKGNILAKTGFWNDIPHLDLMSFVLSVQLLAYLDTEEPLHPWEYVIRVTKLELDLSGGDLRNKALVVPVELIKALDSIVLLHYGLEASWSEGGKSHREILT
jgi:hypothetical protein